MSESVDAGGCAIGAVFVMRPVVLVMRKEVGCVLIGQATDYRSAHARTKFALAPL
jgi:hypothetical protein